MSLLEEVTFCPCCDNEVIRMIQLLPPPDDIPLCRPCQYWIESQKHPPINYGHCYCKTPRDILIIFRCPRCSNPEVEPTSPDSEFVCGYCARKLGEFFDESDDELREEELIPKQEIWDQVKENAQKRDQIEEQREELQDFEHYEEPFQYYYGSKAMLKKVTQLTQQMSEIIKNREKKEQNSFPKPIQEICQFCPNAENYEFCPECRERRSKIRVYLNVPFSEKDFAKVVFKAKWDKPLKKWWVTGLVDLRTMPTKWLS